MAKYQRLPGTQDILPEVQHYWEHFRNQVTQVARRYGFQKIDTPIFEYTELFTRGVGEGTDIVEKEMYAFQDKGKRDIALRPEFTAGVVRAYIENGMRVLPHPLKLYSIGPAFRYERQQAGRYRQFHQFNAEIIGVAGPLADLDIMLMAWDIYDGLGFEDLNFQLNSTGCSECRPQYIASLQEHYHAHAESICADCKRRIDKNPLRVLDCKQERCQPIIASAPKIMENLCAECEQHFGELRGYLDGLGKSYTINHKLVRGLDYYSKTVFEVWAQDIGAQSAVCGGGRYDGLIELVGGKHTPAVGFAAGIERAVMVMQNQNVAVPEISAPPVFVIFLGDGCKPTAVKLLTQIRQAGIGAQISTGGSMRSQLRQADKRHARMALILGDDEVEQGIVTLRNLSERAQEVIALSEIVTVIKQHLTTH